MVSGSSIKGSLKYLDSGDIADELGAGYFMALDFGDNVLADFTSVKVGMRPSAGVEPVELVGAETQKCVFKVSNKFNQKFVLTSTDGTNQRVQTYDLSQLDLIKQ